MGTFPLGTTSVKTAGDSEGKESACYAGDLGLIPGSGIFPGEENGYALQYSCLENPMDRVAWQAIDHGIARVGHNLATKPPPATWWLLKLKLNKTQIFNHTSQSSGAQSS